MSRKRTSPESSIDKQTNEDSDSFQQDEDAKRAKLTSLSDTTLHDLPMELIESILIKAVAMEVMDMTRKNSEWKEAAEPVISRLTTVCSQWTSILTTNYFRNELHRTFDAEKSIRLEIVQKIRVSDLSIQALAFGDEVFVLCMPIYDDNNYIEVYDRNNVAEVKDVIPLAGVKTQDMAACNVSNCLYVLNTKVHNLSILRITKTDEHQFDISPLISGMQRRYVAMSVAPTGNLVLSWHQRKEQRALIMVYGPNGAVLHETWLSSHTYCPFYKVIPKSNGNFVLVSSNDDWETKLTEIDVHGIVIRQCQSPLRAGDAACQADKYGRIGIVRRLGGTELLDSDLNQLEYSGPQLEEGEFYDFGRMHFNSERNEVVTIVDLDAVIILRFIEE